MDLNKLTAVKIKETRKKLGLTADAIAQDMGISTGAYSRLENGHIEIGMSKIETLAEVMKVHIGELIPVRSGNSQVSHGSGDNYNANSNVTNNFFATQDEKTLKIIETLSQIINDLKKDSEE